MTVTSSTSSYMTLTDLGRLFGMSVDKIRTNEVQFTDTTLSATEQHLLRSPANAERLRAALRQSKAGKGRLVSLDDLFAELGIDVEGE